MRSVRRVFLVTSMLAAVAAGCTSDDGSVAPLSTTIDDARSTGSAQSEVTLSTTAPTESIGDGAVGPATDPPATTVGEPSTTETSSPLGEVPPTTEAGGESLGPLGDSDLDIETGDGRVQIGDAEVPSGLDASFPLPDDLGVQLASETTTDIGFSGTTALSIDELTQFYAMGLPQSGYTITATQIVEGVLAVFTFEGRDRFGQVAISETPGATTSTLLVTIGDGVGQEETVSG